MPGSNGFLSDRAHVVKTEPDLYNLLVSRYDLTPERTVFIDDTPANIEAAIKLGWKGIIYKSYEQVKKELQKLGVKY